ncbi:MAG: ankyrin repeat domain-containing protein [Bacteroidales bacterium]|nr:ankyrin repeat domain-containing protein [Bacteroidales bacterium]
MDKPHKTNETITLQNNKNLAQAIKTGSLSKVKKLLSGDIDINNTAGGYCETPLILACYHKNYNITKEIISAGANINQKIADGKTALITACDSYQGDSVLVAKLVKLLLENGAKPNQNGKDKDGAIHYAAMYGHFEAVKLLIEYKANINSKGAYGRTALIYASASSGSLEIVKLLIENGANIKAKNDAGENALFDLITREKANTEVADFLIEKGININLSIKSYGTALHWAAFCGRLNIVKLLLDKGAKFNTKNDLGNTPLRQAMSQHKTDIVKFLFRKGAKTETEGFMGWSVLEYAVEKNDLDFVVEIIIKLKKDKEKLPIQALKEAARKGNLPAVKILLEAGIPTEDETSNDETPLMKAAYYGKLDVVNFLLEKGANIKAKDYRGNTALLHAAWSGHTNVVAELLKKGAKVNEKNKLNWNALMQACIEGHYGTAKLLLEKGSPTDEIDMEKGATALTLAKVSRSQKLIDLLVKYGAQERKIKTRKKNEEYFSIFECEICEFLPHKKDLGRTEEPEKFKGLEIIFSEETYPERYGKDSHFVLKCSNCGTFYHHYHSIDTEDAFISGPWVSQKMLRYNLQRLKTILKKLEKEAELEVINDRYNKIIQELELNLTSNKKIPKNFLQYVIENLTDYYILQNDWDSIKKNLLEHKNPLIIISTAYDLLILNHEKQYDQKFPSYREYRDCPAEIQEPFKPLFKEHFEEIYKIVQKFKNSKNYEIKHKYYSFMSSVKYYKLKD